MNPDLCLYRNNKIKRIPKSFFTLDYNLTRFVSCFPRNLFEHERNLSHVKCRLSTPLKTEVITSGVYPLKINFAVLSPVALWSQASSQLFISVSCAKSLWQCQWDAAQDSLSAGYCLPLLGSIDRENFGNYHNVVVCSTYSCFLW